MRGAWILLGVLGCSRPITTASAVSTGAEAPPAAVGPVDAGVCAEPDRDGDGVVDVCDVCPDEAGARPDGCVHRVVIQAQEIWITPQLFFPAHGAVVQPAGMPVLDEIAAVLRAHPEIQRVALRGHASAGERDAVALSRRRAEVARDYLTAHGVEAARLVVQARGTEEPIDPRATPEGRARNRRVEFRIEAADPPPPPAPQRSVPAGCPDAPPVRPGPCR
ncbi:MAG: OmpA family protein [Polyangiales bacterium]